MDMPENRDSDVDIGSDANVTRAVHRAKVELEHMIDLTPQVMLLVDPKGQITRANIACLRLLGCVEFDGVLGRKIEDFFEVDEEDFFQNLLEEEGGYRMREVHGSTTNGRSGIFRFTVVGVGDDSSADVLIVEDITLEKEKAALDEKEHKKDAVRALAGALMHNINQRLTVITVRSKLMLMALEKEDVSCVEMKSGLNDIVKLTMEVAEILDRAENHKDYVMEPYVDGLEILDLERSSGKRGSDD